VTEKHDHNWAGTLLYLLLGRARRCRTCPAVQLPAMGRHAVGYDDSRKVSQ
jgi:hypothetical protein